MADHGTGVAARAWPVNRWLLLWFAANTVSHIGNRIYSLAIPWMVMSITGSALQMNAIWAVEMLPFVLLGPFLGALVDRLDRRRVLIVADISQAVLVGAIPLLASMGHLQLWHLYVAGFLLNCFALTGNLVSDFGIIPRLAQGRSLPLANSIHFALMNLSAVAGPAVGGALIAWMDAPGALVFDSLSFLATVLVVAALPIGLGRGEPEQVRTVRGLLAGAAGGFRFLWADGLLRRLALGLCLTNLATGALFTTMTYHLGQEWALPPDLAGLGFSVAGTAAVAGSVLAPVLLRRFALGKAVVAMGTVMAAGLAVSSLGAHWTVALAGFGLYNLASTVSNIATFTIRQEAIPGELMGQVNAAFRSLLTLSFPLSALLLGTVTELSSAKVGFGVSAVIQVVAFLTLWLSPVSGHGRNR